MELEEGLEPSKCFFTKEVLSLLSHSSIKKIYRNSIYSIVPFEKYLIDLILGQRLV
jgi:hypothetical protein